MTSSNHERFVLMKLENKNLYKKNILIKKNNEGLLMNNHTLCNQIMSNRAIDLFHSPNNTIEKHLGH